MSRKFKFNDHKYSNLFIYVNQVELKHTIEMVHEEQERIVKLETIKKSLEVEVKVGLNITQIF